MKIKKFFWLGFLIVGLHADLYTQSLSEKTRIYFYGLYQKCLNALQRERVLARSWLSGKVQEHYNSSNPFKDQQAHVRLGVSISEQEKEFLNIRSEVSLEALKNFLGDQSLTLETMPRIGVCVSGGGFRSAVAALGSFQGMHDIGMLDAILIASGISGGTWLIGPWVYGKMTLDEFKQIIPMSLEHAIGSFAIDIVHASIFKKMIFGQPISIIDVYGALVARSFLKNFGAHCNTICISACQADPRSHPYPVFAALEPLSQWTVDYCKGYRWYEINPYEVGTDDLRSESKGAFVPVWAWGREFKDGKSVDNGPEQSLGFFMAVCGSAFEFALRDVTPKLAKDLTSVEQDLLDELPDLLNLAPASIKRFLPSLDTFKKELRDSFAWLVEHRRAPASFHSIVPGLQDTYTTLVDAGVACNIPLHAAMRKDRALDVIIVLDATSPIGRADQLKVAQRFAKSRGYELPPIDYHKIGENIISIFGDDTMSKPTIIYIPLQNNPNYSQFDVSKCETADFCATFNVHYTQKQVDELSKFTRFTLNEQKDVLKQALKKVVAYKGRR